VAGRPSSTQPVTSTVLCPYKCFTTGVSRAELLIHFARVHTEPELWASIRRLLPPDSLGRGNFEPLPRVCHGDQCGLFFRDAQHLLHHLIGSCKSANPELGFMKEPLPRPVCRLCDWQGRSPCTRTEGEASLARHWRLVHGRKKPQKGLRFRNKPLYPGKFWVP
jgi:hypothetical protein